MLTESQLRIFEPLTKNMLKEYSIKEIKEYCGEKSNNALSLALKKFKDEDLVKERRVGRSLLYTLNIDNDLVFNYITLINTKKLPKSVLRAIERIKEDVEKHTSFFSIVIFGSYAIGKQTKDSDLDVAVFIEEENKRKMIETAIKSSELKTPLEIHSNVISKEEFLEMLKIDNENLGKQIARKHLSIYNSHIFYSLLKRGIKNGFRY
ncbi:nucleotidyltransferase domain-containing protein [Candidatus Pacearchaeota archaeon]|nr:nucleotidyltransferase domain-containing protein [Candidatus Pacearchaeota archaeon]